jgi:hypothetical protein
MLDKTCLQSPARSVNFPVISRPLAGKYLAHTKLAPCVRALLAGDLATGKAHLVEPTIKQVALLARVSNAYAAAGRDVVCSQPHKRSAVEHGECSLLAAANRKSSVGERLAKAWAKANAEERTEFIRLIGPDAVFSATIEAV